MDLPDLNPDESELLHAMHALLDREIAAAGGDLPFDRYMELALYAPGLGYYVNARHKIGAAGDFVTAPEVSPLFGGCVAAQVAECLRDLDDATVLECGAGSGRLAADLLSELERLDALPARYAILEVSPGLRQQQRETLSATVPRLLERVEWLNALPDAPFDGVVLGNELLDAMPVHGFRRCQGAWQERHVTRRAGRLCDSWRPIAAVGLQAAIDRLWDAPEAVAEGYQSELNMRLTPWLQAIAAVLRRGYTLLIDYGYTRREYYHPERSGGTLIGHYRHRAIADPYLLPGLQDLTANVDFTALGEGAVAAGFAVAGYTTQAHFLIDNGLDRLLQRADPGDVGNHLQRLQGVKLLTLPSEMGERFKVMALARGVAPRLQGFRSRDLRDRL